VVTIVAATNTPENTTIMVPFTVANVPANFNTFDLDGISSNTNLVASVGITGSGTNYTAILATSPYKNGTTTITIVAQTSFAIGTGTSVLTVTPVEYPPTFPPIPDTNTTVNTSVNVPLNVTDVAESVSNLTYSAVISDSNVIQAVTFAYVGGNEVATIVPTPNKSGAAAITITVSDGVTNLSRTFAVTVSAPTPPTLGPIATQTTSANTPISVSLSVTSPSTALTNLTFSGSSNNTNLVKSIVFSFNGTNEVATLTPGTNATGSGTITISVSDGYSTNSQSFLLTVNPPTPPTLGPIANQSTTENSAVNVSLNVTSPVTPLTNLTFSGSSTNTSLIKSITFALNGSNEVATITPVTNATGVGTVTISVSDKFSTNSQSFTLQVNSPTPPTLTAVLVNGVLKITFTGTPGVTYSIQSSADLVNWTTIASVSANASTGAAEYDTTPSAAYTFFRAETP
jgi:hypothetical protein